MIKTIGFLALVGLIIYVIAQTPGTSTSTTPAKVTSAVPRSIDPHEEGRRRAKDAIEIRNFKWGKAGFGTIMEASFTFDNKSDYDVKDITVRCTLSAASGTAIDRSTKTIYEAIPARSSKSIKDFNMGFVHSQAARAGCDVIDAEAGNYRAPPTKPAPKTTGAAKP